MLKIDRSFVAGVDSGRSGLELVRSIVGLAQSLGLDTVAEGIEEISQLEGLRAVNARFGQGHLFARPMEASDFGELLCGRPAKQMHAAAPQRAVRTTRERSHAARVPATTR